MLRSASRLNGRNTRNIAIAPSHSPIGTKSMPMTSPIVPISLSRSVVEVTGCDTTSAVVAASMSVSAFACSAPVVRPSASASAPPASCVAPFAASAAPVESAPRPTASSSMPEARP